MQEPSASVCHGHAVGGFSPCCGLSFNSFLKGSFVFHLENEWSYGIVGWVAACDASPPVCSTSQAAPCCHAAAAGLGRGRSGRSPRPGSGRCGRDGKSLFLCFSNNQASKKIQKETDAFRMLLLLWLYRSHSWVPGLVVLGRAGVTALRRLPWRREAYLCLRRRCVRRGTELAAPSAGAGPPPAFVQA